MGIIFRQGVHSRNTVIQLEKNGQIRCELYFKILKNEKFGVKQRKVNLRVIKIIEKIRKMDYYPNILEEYEMEVKAIV